MHLLLLRTVVHGLAWMYFQVPGDCGACAVWRELVATLEPLGCQDHSELADSLAILVRHSTSIIVWNDVAINVTNVISVIRRWLCVCWSSFVKLLWRSVFKLNSLTRSLRFSANCIGWKLQREFSTNSMSWRLNVCMAQRHHTSLTSSSGLWTSKLEVIFAQRHHITDRPSYLVVDCRRPSCSGRRFPPVFGRNCHATSLLLHRPCEVYVVVRRLIFSVVLFPTFCGACEVTWVIIERSNRFCNLSAYLVTLFSVNV